jgi:hypothetical protein
MYSQSDRGFCAMGQKYRSYYRIFTQNATIANQFATSTYLLARTLTHLCNAFWGHNVCSKGFARKTKYGRKKKSRSVKYWAAFFILAALILAARLGR